MALIMRFLNIIAEFFIFILMFPLSFFWHKNYYLFYSPLGNAGNIKYVHDYFCSQGKQVFYINKNEKMSCIKLAKLFLGSRCLFLSHGIGGLPLYVFFTKRVQLWHGLPIKKILLDYHRDTKHSKFSTLNKIYKYCFALRINISYSELVTSDSYLGKKLALSMGMKADKVKYLGTPSISQAYRVEKCRNPENDGTYNVLYMPTWRDGLDTVKNIVYEFIKIQDFLEEENITIYCKLHPLDSVVFENKVISQNVRLVGKNVCDIIELISGHNCLITDYSSVCFESAPIKTTCIFYVPDLDCYFKNRGAYININEFYKGEPRGLSELKGALRNAKNCKIKNKNLTEYIGDNENALFKIYECYK